MIGVCWKWVDRRPEVDPLTGAIATDARTSGASDADQAALEWALCLGDTWATEVIVATAGPPAAEPMLRDALAAGAAQARRIDLPAGASSERVASALVATFSAQVDVMICGAWSIDRGSGSVPAYLAAGRGASQALGLIRLDFDATPGVVRAERRLDGGRRERLQLRAPAVMSVEGGTRLRRASLDSVLAAQDATIDVIIPDVATVAPASRVVHRGPFRPRPRVLPPPSSQLSARERVLALTGALVDRAPPRLVRLDPGPAADELLAQLDVWGYR
jgi:electron transfer flavoprotein beta subunit